MSNRSVYYPTNYDAPKDGTVRKRYRSGLHDFYWRGEWRPYEPRDGTVRWLRRSW